MMFEKTGQIKRFKDGQVIFYENDPGKIMYVIESGKVKLTRTKMREGENIVTTLAVLEKGNFFGEMSLFDYRPRSATATAVGDVELRVVTRKDLESQIKENPELALYFLDKMSQRVRKIDDLIETLLVRERLAKNVYDKLDTLRYPEFI
ncbi:MAG: cyclic nucleotide-binding domain-containing protein [Methanocellales archaeon]|nr:cyclic nucleotide-binding domain-containing protein [Methanocellales archaeon]